MGIKEQLFQEKTNLLNEIAEFAKRGESHEVLAVGKTLNRVESLIERYEQLALDVSNLSKDKIQDIQTLSQTRKKPSTKRQNLVAAGRGIGKLIRMEFLKKASEKGIFLDNIKGSIYQTQSGSKVGIAVATERKPDRWFLGLPLESFDIAVLLCKPESGDTLEICLSKDFFNQFGNEMSESSGQMKFNVARRGNGYAILVPGTDGINVSHLIGDYAILR